jgi:CRISPR-associated protein Csd1
MILKALTDLAHRERLVDDPDFEPKEVRWIIHINTRGEFLGVTQPEGTRGAKGKLRPKVIQVPRFPVRANNPPPCFLVDKAEFVLGFDPVGDRQQDVLRERNQAFRDYVLRAMEHAPEDEALRAVVRFLDEAVQKSRCQAVVQDEAQPNDLFAFQFGDDTGKVHDREAVRCAWKAIRAASLSSGTTRTKCLVCGKDGIPIRLHPQIKNVPGGSTSGVSVVSFNQDAFESYCFSKNENAPVCHACGEAYSTALNRLFHPQYTAPNDQVLGRRSIRLSEDTAVVYWASSEHRIEDEFGGLDYADEAQARALFESVHRGGGVALDDPTPFYALVVTGGKGRATLRGYHQTTVREVAKNLRLYFDDIAMVPRFPNAPRWPAFHWLVRALAAQGKPENVEPDLAGRLFLAVLSGSAFPQSLLHEAVGRIRAEPEDPPRGRYKHTRERLALIRATLNRQFRGPREHRIKALITREIPPMLDPSCTTPAYCLGRLFAVLEKLQAEAIRSPNATIADRFYGAASATPAAVFGTLLRKAQHHRARSPWHGKTIEEVLGLLNPGNAFPKTLTLEEQGLFALGYYHQRAELWKAQPDTGPAVTEPAASA